MMIWKAFSARQAALSLRRRQVSRELLSQVIQPLLAYSTASIGFVGSLCAVLDIPVFVRMLHAASRYGLDIGMEVGFV